MKRHVLIYYYLFFLAATFCGGGIIAPRVRAERQRLQQASIACKLQLSPEKTSNNPNQDSITTNGSPHHDSVHSPTWTLVASPQRRPYPFGHSILEYVIGHFTIAADPPPSL
jgi:hypothetical protein